MKIFSIDVVIFFALLFSLLWITSFSAVLVSSYNFNNLIGNDIENIRALKIDCEKSLPRDQECILIYEFVPVKKEK